jgi:hypothetical protein
VLAYDLQVIPGGNATTQPIGPASRQQVQTLIAALLDESDLRRGFVAGLHGERLGQYDCAINPAALGMWGPRMLPIVHTLFGPAFELDAIRMMRTTTQTATASQARDWPAAKAQIPDVEKQFAAHSAATGLSRLMSRIAQPALRHAVLRQYRALTERRVAALRLAMRLYQIDHDGRFPARLDDLVPNYIPSVPLDLFAADGRALAYRSSPAPLIYSVGDDGADDGGDITPTTNRPPTTAPAGSPDDTHFWTRRDILFPLPRYVRPTAPPESE